MKFAPKSEQELETEKLARGIWPNGVYAYEVKRAEDATSKAGNEMIHLEVLAYNGEHTREFDDYLLEKLAYKLRSFCKHNGLLDAYQQGTLSAADCEGKSGWVKLGTEKGKPKTNGPGNFDDKNKILEYVAAPVSGAAVKAQPTDEQLANRTANVDEDVPFN